MGIEAITLPLHCTMLLLKQLFLVTHTRHCCAFCMGRRRLRLWIGGCLTCAVVWDCFFMPMKKCNEGVGTLHVFFPSGPALHGFSSFAN